MYRRYAANGGMKAGASSTAAQTCISIIQPTSPVMRPYLYDFTFGATGTPVDSVQTVTVTRASSMTAGTSCAAVTGSPLDSTDQASTTTYGGTWTTEPTIGVILFSVGLNVRATYRWVAAPGGELICPAIVNNGLALRASALAYTGDAQGQVYVAE